MCQELCRLPVVSEKAWFRLRTAMAWADRQAGRRYLELAGAG